MSNLIKFNTANLPSVQQLAQVLEGVVANAPSAMSFLKFDKTGTWIYGSDQVEVDASSVWAVNPYSFTHGYQAWGTGVSEGKLLSEKVVPLAEALPTKGDALEHCEKGWEHCMGVAMVCVEGLDKGANVSYSTKSKGGVSALIELSKQLVAQINTDATNPVPLVYLKGSSYAHSNKAYGKIQVPVLEVCGWTSLSGSQEAVVETPVIEAQEVEVIEEAAPVGRRRRIAQ